MQVFDSLLKIQKEKGAGYLVLIDPDKLSLSSIPDFMLKACDAGVDAVLIGGSLLISGEFEEFVNQVKNNSNGIPASY